MASMICINGSPREVSRTGLLIDVVARAIQARCPLERHDIALSVSAPDIVSGLMRDRLAPAGDALCRLVERADLLVVGSPVYRASYTGIMKHLFDLLDRDALHGRVAVLVATGGTPLHGLVLEHQFRPLMGFFGIQTVATTLYALEDDFPDGRLGVALEARATRAAVEAAALIGAAGSAHLRLAAA